MKHLFLLSLFAGVALSATGETVKTNDSLPAIETREAVVTGTRALTDSRYLPQSVSVVGRYQIEQRHAASLLPLLTEQVPGLFITSRGILGYGVSTGAAGAMKIRGIGGSPTTDLLILIDGHPQYAGLLGHAVADAYQSLLAERVEVVRGPASVLYGSNAIGGVMNIITRRPSADLIHQEAEVAYGSYNTLTTEYGNFIHRGKFSSIVLGSYNRTDGHRTNMDFEQMTGYAKLAYDFTQNWKLTADLNLTHFNASNPGPVNAPLNDNDSHITRGMTSGSLSNQYEKTSGAFTFFYNWGRHRINDGYAEGKQPLDYRYRSKDEMLGFNWFQTAELFSGNRVTVGMDYQHIDGSSWNHYLDGHDGTVSEKRADETAGYVDFRQTLWRLLTLNAGLRGDYHSRCGQSWAPQAGLSVILPAQAEVKLIVSRGFRNPTLKDLYLFRSQNPDLLAERMTNYEIAFSQKLLQGALRYGLNAFYLEGNHFIETVMVGGRPLNVNSGKMYNWGIEAQVTYRLCSSLNFNANYSFLHMRHPVTAAPEHKLFVGADYVQGRWSASTGVQYISGLYTALSPEKKENFVLLNLRAAYEVCRFAKIFVNGENLLAQSYEINVGFPMPRATVMGGVRVEW